MKRKLLGLLMAGVLAASLLAGCGSDSGSEDSIENGSTEQEPAQNEAASSEATAEAEVEVNTELVRDWEQEYDDDVYVAAVDGLSDDFIMGMDISSLLTEEASGVVYYNEDGEEEDLLAILADAGINYVRVRVWNDPYDANGHGYGGGNCDAETAAEIGARAADYGIKLCVDFHYSDFWADPNKQFVPKAWEDMDIDEKAEALKEYTVDSLNTILDAGADIGMVQIGNEINYGMAGETSVENTMTLLKAASEAIRSVDPAIQIVVHYTQLDDESGTLEKAQNLADYGIDYDIFGASYYTYWHGSLENMQNVLSEITTTYGVKTCIMETASPYTTADGDASGNSVTVNWDQYPSTVQGQASCVRDVIEAAVGAGAVGVFYWEGAWVPVGSEYESNSYYWEQYGSGWASSYAAEYDPDDAGLYYGGSSWANQAMFDLACKALPALRVFNYVRTGHETELQVIVYPTPEYDVNLGDEWTMPDTIDVVYNDSTNTTPMPITWNEEQVAAVDTNTPGSYIVRGTAEDGQAIKSHVVVIAENLLQNADFEDEDTSMWDVEYLTSDTSQTDFQNKSADALSGDISFHFWSASDIGFTVEQTVENVTAGSYTAKSNIQGDDMGDASEITLYVKVNGEIVSQSNNITLKGWVSWITTELDDVQAAEGDSITVGMSVSGAANGWGTIDDFELYLQ